MDTVPVQFASPEELRKLAPLLDAADVCLESLSDVLNDTLDFSKLSNAAALSPAEVAAQQLRAVVATDLHSLVEGVTKSVWVRKRRVELVSNDVEQGDHRKRDEQVDLILDVADRPSGWRAMADVGGLKRYVCACCRFLTSSCRADDRSGAIAVSSMLSVTRSSSRRKVGSKLPCAMRVPCLSQRRGNTRRRWRKLSRSASSSSS